MPLCCFLQPFPPIKKTPALVVLSLDVYWVRERLPSIKEVEGINMLQTIAESELNTPETAEESVKSPTIGP